MKQQLTPIPIGIDLASYKTKIAVAKRGGVEIITNEANFRETPCVVGFGPSERQIGESGYIKMKSNFRNSVLYPLRFAGLTPEYPMLRAETKFCPAKNNISSGRLRFDVNYQGQNESFTTEQILAAYLNKLKNIISINGFENKEAVIAVPPFMTQMERKAVLDAARIAEIHVTRLINESSAVALDYGMFRKKQLTENPRNVLFIDFGHSKLSIFCCSFTKDEMNVLFQDFERNIGCRDLDYCMFEFYRNHFQKTSGGCDLLENRKAYIKLMENIERQRKILSGINDYEMNVEYLMEQCDLQYSMTRDQFNHIGKPVFDKMTELLLRTRQILKEKGITLSSVELIGGGTRIPEFIRVAKDIFGHEPSRTLNSSESVARGCALMAAIKSPLFRVQEYVLHEKATYGVKFYWNFVHNDKFLGPNAQLYPEKQGKMIFEAGCKVPSSKTIKFARKEAIEILVEYEPTVVGFRKQIGYFVTKPQHPKQQVFGVQFKLKYTENGIIVFDECSLVEEWTEETKVPIKKEQKPAEKKPEGENKEGAPEQPKPEPQPEEFEIKKSKKQRFSKIDFQSNHYDNFSEKQIQEMFTLESTMFNQDRLILETYERKNELESSLYNWKQKVTGEYSEFCCPGEADKIVKIIQEEHDWLYSEEGENSNRGTYQTKIDRIRKEIKPIQERVDASVGFKNEVQMAYAALKKDFEWINSLEQKYKHIEAEERQPGLNRLEQTRNQVNTFQTAFYQRANKFDALPVSAKDVKKAVSEAHDFVSKIMYKPVPKKEEPKKEEAGKPEEQKKGESQGDAGKPEDTKMQEQK